ncbi:membrane-associated protein, putative [Bodo saltans]|uniref:Membrane-associated protein, putative n=1 Tax=Bodo saltans TaxID=75058 RepID=A0A0S4JJD7_BODSA|nr:membrane-associated protein, putative [Bodo saltans]|eukprot:CUG91660.1 membrane-associated protein, putative [Bodo saltans]
MWRHCTLVVAVWLCYLAVDISALVVDCSSNATAISGAPETPIIQISAVETNILVTSCWIGTHYAAPLYIDFGVACSNVVLTVVNVTGLGSIHCEPFAADNLSITVYNSTAQVLVDARSGWATIVFMSIAAVVPISNIAMTLVNVSGTLEKVPSVTSAVAQIIAFGAARSCSMRMIGCQFWGAIRPNYQKPLCQ